MVTVALWACGAVMGGDIAWDVQIVGDPSPPATIVDTSLLEFVVCSSFKDAVSMSFQEPSKSTAAVFYCASATDAHKMFAIYTDEYRLP